MTNWITTVKIKHLLTSKEDYESLKKSMNDIYHVLVSSNHFLAFPYLKDFKDIPDQDEDTLKYANKLISLLYDYADDYAIWIE